MKPSASLHNRLSQSQTALAGKNQHTHLGQAALLSGMDAWRRNSVDEAGNYLSEAVSLMPTDEKALFYTGEVHRLRGNIEDAKMAFALCLEQNPDHGRAIVRLRQMKEN